MVLRSALSPVRTITAWPVAADKILFRDHKRFHASALASNLVALTRRFMCSSRSVPEPPDRGGCCFCMHASRAAASNAMAVLKVPAKGHMYITVAEGENEPCLMALAATLHALFSALTGHNIMPPAAR